MYKDENAFIVDGINLGPYITQIEYQYNKLWASDSGRNLAGKQVGTLIGIFPKFVVHFKPLNQTELETIAPILDSNVQTVQYYDPNFKRMLTISTYSGDWKTLNKNVIKDLIKNGDFTISFIAREKRA